MNGGAAGRIRRPRRSGSASGRGALGLRVPGLAAALGGRALDRPLGVPALRAAGADLHATRLARLRLRDGDREHAPLELRGDGVGVDALGKRQRSAEAAEAALDTEPALALLLVLVAALTRDRQHVVVDLDRHVLLAQPGQVGAQDVVVLGLYEVHRRAPALRAASLRREQRVEQPAHLGAKRVWPHQEGHRSYLLA